MGLVTVRIDITIEFHCCVMDAVITLSMEWLARMFPFLWSMKSSHIILIRIHFVWKFGWERFQKRVSCAELSLKAVTSDIFSLIFALVKLCSHLVFDITSLALFPQKFVSEREGIFLFHNMSWNEFVHAVYTEKALFSIMHTLGGFVLQRCAQIAYLDWIACRWPYHTHFTTYYFFCDMVTWAFVPNLTNS